MSDKNQDQSTPRALDDSLQISVLGHLLRGERNQSESTLETLASLLQAAVPDRVQVTVGGWPWSRKRPVESLSIQFDDSAYHIASSKQSAPIITKQKISRGITLKSTQIAMEDCITEIVAKLGEIEQRSDATRRALQKFVQGR